jgi:hypothetical protein
MREASDSAWSRTPSGTPASLCTDTVTGNPFMTGTFDQAAEHEAVMTTTNQSDFRDVFWNTVHTSKMEARIG